MVNKEVLALYYAIGGFISLRSRTAQWGTNAIGVISELLQQELPGLRGFSETNIKRMRIFYEEWRGLFEIRPPVADELTDVIIPMGDTIQIMIRPLSADELSREDMEAFLSVGFTHHSEILAKAKDEHESRREWLLDRFWFAGANDKRIKNYRFWQEGNHVEEIYTMEFLMQKLNYIHQNPVRAEIVARPEDYLYSSALNYAGEKGLLDVEVIR